MSEDKTQMGAGIELVMSHVRFLMGCGRHDEALKYIKSNRLSIDCLYLSYIPLLYLAANEGCMPLVKYLIEQGTDIIEIFGERVVARTPLGGAFYGGHMEVMALLYHYERQLEYNPYEDRTLHYLELLYKRSEEAKQFHEACERLAKENPRLPECTIKRLQEKYPRPEAKVPRVSPVAMFGSGAGSGASAAVGSPKTDDALVAGESGAGVGAVFGMGGAPMTADKAADGESGETSLLGGTSAADGKSASGLRRRKPS